MSSLYFKSSSKWNSYNLNFPAKMIVNYQFWIVALLYFYTVFVPRFSYSFRNSSSETLLGSSSVVSNSRYQPIIFIDNKNYGWTGARHPQKHKNYQQVDRTTRTSLSSSLTPSALSMTTPMASTAVTMAPWQYVSQNENMVFNPQSSATAPTYRKLKFKRAQVVHNNHHSPSASEQTTAIHSQNTPTVNYSKVRINRKLAKTTAATSSNHSDRSGKSSKNVFVAKYASNMHRVMFPETYSPSIHFYGPSMMYMMNNIKILPPLMANETLNDGSKPPTPLNASVQSSRRVSKRRRVVKTEQQQHVNKYSMLINTNQQKHYKQKPLNNNNEIKKNAELNKTSINNEIEIRDPRPKVKIIMDYVEALPLTMDEPHPKDDREFDLLRNDIPKSNTMTKNLRRSLPNMLASNISSVFQSPPSFRVESNNFGRPAPKPGQYHWSFNPNQTTLDLRSRFSAPPLRSQINHQKSKPSTQPQSTYTTIMMNNFGLDPRPLVTLPPKFPVVISNNRNHHQPNHNHRVNNNNGQNSHHPHPGQNGHHHQNYQSNSHHRKPEPNGFVPFARPMLVIRPKPDWVVRPTAPPPPPSSTTTTTTTTTTTPAPATPTKRIIESYNPSGAYNYYDDYDYPIATTTAAPRRRNKARKQKVQANSVPGSAERCTEEKCQSPYCRCGSSTIPGGLKAKDIPQLVMITFDDSINDLNWDLYQEIFNSRYNPNGCPILGTFYVSHEWTDYSQVQNLYAAGHEMASHTITFGDKFSKDKWLNEVNGQREILYLYGGVKYEDVRGMRAPFLQPGGNKQFEMLYEANFTYDSSLPVFENKPPYWPYTFDYAMSHECMIAPCPTKSFPGLWEVGMVMLIDHRGGRCSMVDACSHPATEEAVFDDLLKNFNRHYHSNKAPFGLYFHSAWFNTAHFRRAFMRFIDHIGKNKDVYFVTKWQLIQWMQNPTPVSRLKSFEPFHCDYSDRQPCHHPSVCSTSFRDGPRYLKTCQKCPKKYPWVGKTGFAHK